MQLTERVRGSEAAVDDIVDSMMQVGRLMRQRMQADGHEPGTFLLLKYIHTAGSMRVTDLAASAGLDASTVSRHVTQLERSGHLLRTRDPDDRRAQRVELTDQGHDVLRRAFDRRRAFIADGLRHWTTEDLQQLRSLMQRFLSDIEPTTSAHQEIA